MGRRPAQSRQAVEKSHLRRSPHPAPALEKHCSFRPCPEEIAQTRGFKEPGGIGERERFALDTKGRFLYLVYKTSKGAGVLHYEDVILFILAKANQRVHSRFKPMFQRYGLTPMQSLVLTALFQDEGLPAGEIGRRLVLDSATLSGVLVRMEEAGWLIRSTPDGDRRVTNLHLTEKALGIRDAMLDDVEAMNREVLSVFKPEERLLLERMLKDLWR